jgi:OOP family OmpA-OmpF porin
VSRVEQQLMTGNLVLENVYFETESAALKPESRSVLDEVGTAMEKLPGVRFEVQGHTDSRGAAAYNKRLSQGRAESVRQYLLENFKLEPGNFEAVGYGESRLMVSPESTPEDLQRNRRVEIKVLNPDALPKGVEVERR